MAHIIKKAAVIGAGTMGSQLAALIAGTNTPVLLLDTVPKGVNDRDIAAKRAIEALKSSSTIPPDKARYIEPGNIEDDMDKLSEVDWVVECVPEDMAIKQDTYRKVGEHTPEHTIISSNTSTIPLHILKSGLDSKTSHQLCITHFFNPATQMPLVELVSDQDNDPDTLYSLAAFADDKLGKQIVEARDTPGFIANRIGLFWMLAGMEEARRENLPAERADAIMNGTFGFPKTGIFGLADLIGLGVIPEIIESMRQYLPPEDLLCQLDLSPIQKQIEIKRAFHTNTQKRKEPITVEHWHEFLNKDTADGRFARRTLTRTIEYTTFVAPVIADSILQIDTAMRTGYGWHYGPFELADRLGATWLTEQLEQQNMFVPLLLKQAHIHGFYRTLPDGEKEYLCFSGRYRSCDRDVNAAE